jgi:hypothetical protein
MSKVKWHIPEAFIEYNSQKTPGPHTLKGRAAALQLVASLVELATRSVAMLILG